MIKYRNTHNMSTQVHTFTVEIYAIADVYQIHARSLLVGETNNLTEVPIDALLPYLSLNSYIANQAFTYNQIVQAGYKLYNVLFQEEIEVLFRDARARTGVGNILRILFTFPKKPQLHEIPWEILSDDGETFLIEDPRITIARYVRQSNPPQSITVNDSVLRILFTSSSPQDQALLDVQSEENIIRNAVTSLEKARLLRLECLQNVSYENFENELLLAYNEGRPYHIVHHCGHGKLEDREFNLVFEENKISQFIKTGKLQRLFGELPDLKLGIFNVCHGATPLGLIPRLSEINIPSVIGMRNSIYDETALEFSKSLYRAILYQEIDVALAQACRCLKEASIEFLFPVIYLRTTNALLRVPEISAKYEVDKGTSTIEMHITRAKRVIGVMSNDDTPGQPNSSQVKMDITDADDVIGIMKLNSSDVKRYLLND